MHIYLFIIIKNKMMNECKDYVQFLDCGQFAVVNGEVNTSLGTSIGSLATVKCDEGYDLQGSSEINCTNTGWNETVSCQIQGTYYRYMFTSYYSIKLRLYED
jgi:hypothetical protein